MKPNIITANYKIVTPMFIGDANQQATNISPASVKGALRFWWRALNWGRIKTNIEDESEALRELYRQECDIFGSAAEKGAGQAKFILRVNFSNSIKNDSTPSKPNSGIQYLLGQGLYHFKNGYLRDSIPTGTFTIECVFKPDKNKENIRHQISEVLLAFGTLGGLGSRMRKGFGSVAIQKINCNHFSVPTSEAELKHLISQWRQPVDSPPFTAFSKLTRIDISSKNEDAIALLNNAGIEQQSYRSYGRKASHDSYHKVNGKKAEQNFSKDHDALLDFSKGKIIKKIPDRSVFGLPHNYFFSSTRKNIEFTVKEEKRSRRASPLFIHVHEFPDGKAILLHTLFPSVFLPENTKLEFKLQRGKNSILSFKQAMIDWNYIHTYLDRFAEKEQIL